MKTAIIVLDGVLRPTAHPDGVDTLGCALFHTLVKDFRIILLDERAAHDTQHWLDVHGITGYNKTYTPPADFAPVSRTEGRLRLLAAIRATDGADLIIDADPDCAAEAVRAGYTVMLYGKPEYALDVWDPDNPRTPRPWDAIVTEIDRQRAAKARDTRLKESHD